jgi:hypothetical protein
MKIGCQDHSFDDWKSLTEEKICSMAADAREFYGEYKNILLSLMAKTENRNRNIPPHTLNSIIQIL